MRAQDAAVHEADTDDTRTCIFSPTGDTLTDALELLLCSVGERVLAVAVGAVQQQNQGVKDAPEMLLSSLGQSEVLLSSLRPFLQSAPGSVAAEHAAPPAALRLTGV